MSADLPAPSIIVELSLSMVIFLARPRSSSFTFSSLMPRSSVMALPPVKVAMSSSMAPGFDRSALQRAAQLIDHERGERFAFYFFGSASAGLAALVDAFA